MRVDDEPRHLVGLVGDHVFGQERRERQVGQRELRGDPLFAGLRRDARQPVAAAQRRGAGHQRLEIVENVAARTDGRLVHGRFREWVMRL